MTSYTQAEPHWVLRKIDHWIWGYDMAGKSGPGNQPPTGPFDPAGAWAQTYMVCYIKPLVSVREDHPALPRVGSGGRLELTRKPATDGAKLAVNMDVIEFPVQQEPEKKRSNYLIDAQIQCRTDRLSTPDAWTLTSKVTWGDEMGELTDTTQMGRADERGVEISEDGKTRRIVTGTSFTSEWTLFDALQRMAPGEGKPIDFTLLQELELPKRGQTLQYRESFDADLGLGPQRLHYYRHLGAGLLPWHYVVDDPGRLLYAISDNRAIVLNKSAQI